MIIPVLMLSLMAVAGAGLGGLIALALKRITDRMLDIMLGFTSGVMIAIIFFELIVQSINIAGLFLASTSFVFGVALLLLADRFLPHVHVKLVDWLKVKHARSELIKCGLLTAIGMSIHNFPEGIAIGAGYLMLPTLGLFLAMIITIHNIPEGIAITAPLHAGGLKRRDAFLISSLASLVEPLAAVISIVSLQVAPVVVQGSALAFAGGAMFYITGDELIPESHAHGYEHEATIAMVAGLLATMTLSNILGI